MFCSHKGSELSFAQRQTAHPDHGRAHQPAAIQQAVFAARGLPDTVIHQKLVIGHTCATFRQSPPNFFWTKRRRSSGVADERLWLHYGSFSAIGKLIIRSIRELQNLSANRNEI